jgi:hypothetical protein
MATRANKQTAIDFIQAINSGDKDCLLQLMHDAATWTVPQSAVAPYAGTHQGASVIADMMVGAVEQAFDADGVHHDVGLCVAEGEHVVLETRMTARQPTGKSYENAYVFIFCISDGRIVSIREHVDTAYAIQFFAMTE